MILKFWHQNWAARALENHFPWQQKSLAISDQTSVNEKTELSLSDADAFRCTDDPSIFHL